MLFSLVQCLNGHIYLDKSLHACDERMAVHEERQDGARMVSLKIMLWALRLTEGILMTHRRLVLQLNFQSHKRTMRCKSDNSSSLE